MTRRSVFFALCAAVVLLTACAPPDPPEPSASAGLDPDDGSVADAEAFAGLVDIGEGRHMYIECAGQGAPTVVLVSGLDVAGDLWDSPLGPEPRVFPEIAKTNRVCVYDRPGTTRAIAAGGASRSDPVPQPTTTADAVADLHAVLTAAEVTGPLVLVGHSYGGVITRLYAGMYPDEVVGMVLVDSLSPELRAQMSAAEWAVWNVANARTAEQIADYPDLERIDADAALDQVESAARIRQMPLVVITADEKNGPKMEAAAGSGGLPPGVPADFGYLIDAAHEAAQAEVALLVDGAWHVVAHSGHNVMVDNAPVLIAGIDAVLDAAREGRTTTQEWRRNGRSRFRMETGFWDLVEPRSPRALHAPLRVARSLRAGAHRPRLLRKFESLRP